MSGGLLILALVWGVATGWWGRRLEATDYVVFLLVNWLAFFIIAIFLSWALDVLSG